MASPPAPAPTISVREAAALVGVHANTIRRAIYMGELVAHIPAGRDPRHAGGFGYRLDREAVLRWYAGPSPE